MRFCHNAMTTEDTSGRSRVSSRLSSSGHSIDSRVGVTRFTERLRVYGELNLDIWSGSRSTAGPAYFGMSRDGPLLTCGPLNEVLG
jgi:hypothetical protein